MADAIPTLSKVDLLSHVPSNCIAYFCAEFAFDENLPLYAGGLGVLAGDMLTQAAQEQKPFVGVGLIYHKGYVQQRISREANIYEEQLFDYKKAGISLVTENGLPFTVSIPIGSRTVSIQVYVKMIGSVPLLLLDTAIDGNDAHDREICDRLYFGDREHRLEQEMVLGIGGARLLAALGIVPHIYHLNEGHSALLLYELARMRCAKGMSPQAALQSIRNVIFTNHTIVPSGNDVFSKDLCVSYLASYALEFPIEPHVLVQYGLIEDSSLFSPTMLALRLSSVSQAVSKLHAQKAGELWSHHPMTAVTNGVRQAFWQTSEIHGAQTADELWKAHLKRKQILCAFVQDVTGYVWDPNSLIIGWSRRIVRYKRPLALFEDMDKLRRLLQRSLFPVRLIISGKPHTNDQEGQEMLRQILRIVGETQGAVAYIQNYSLPIAKIILSGIDVLTNTSVYGFEACGTSGMKAGLNGVLQCVVKDGWMDEVDWTGMGWVLDKDHPGISLYGLLEQEIIPMYSQRDAQGVPQIFVERMQKTKHMVEEHYTAHRMLGELYEKIYSAIEN
ncbi:hypothetical protein C5B42_06135 [Candidatus Cerribacteria bacterium 'Amazon FNV 2010 28 9']|uniref:glycogen phosphorylase n=1 Tax=Candidatus Cerribacteria bacterium 'Amazon FNV 2010 28 9' TaxID=2081795 RepID=A0A317JQU2_9BACT|nr:MAG: hypothetical protein C5B42_06135 [Candidatus Cerribacteria bacterium 'Amazon FNV 2010 28 9']